MVVEIIVIIAGVLLIVFRQRLSKFSIKFQSEFLRRQFGEVELKTNEIIFILVGLAAIALAIWGVIRGS